MRASMKFVVVTGELILLGLLLAATARAAEFPPIKPTYLVASGTAAASPYSATRPVRVSMVNKLGQVSTLEYREPQRYLDDEPLLPMNDLPLLSSPARASDLYDDRNIHPIGYTYQSNYASQPQTLPIVPTGNCVAPSVVNYPPVTQYTMPNYAVPVTGVPQTVYRPVAPLAPVAVQSNVQVGAGIYGQPVIYRPGQPVRNVWRWLTP